MASTQNVAFGACGQLIRQWFGQLAALFLLATVTAQASLEAYDDAIGADAAAGLAPTARLTTALTLTGSNRLAFDFGAVPGDATMEFILDGKPDANAGAYLAVGANATSNLRYAQWANTRQLGFTQLGVADYLFSPAIASPTQPTHIAYVWKAATRTMRLYANGALAGSASGIDPGFAMPTGRGWLGANPSAGEAMVGTVHRVTVYAALIAAEVIQEHADAFAGVVRPPTIVSFGATPTALFTPNSGTLHWEVRQATAVFINGQEVTGRSTLTVAPSTTTTYTLVATNTGASSQAQVTVLVDPAPVIRRFTASRAYVGPEDMITLTWEVDYGQRFSIAPDPGDVTAETVDGVGATQVRPAASRSYTLKASNAFGTATATVDVHLVQPAHHLVISEFMADDQSTLADEDGEHSGWIEIHNPTASAVNLAGYSLTDRSANPTQWGFPATTLAPGAYLVVFASGKNRAGLDTPLHTSFRLANGGEFLALVGPGPVWLQTFAPAFPPQRADISYGLLGDDPSLVRYLGVPTPGAPNSEAPPPPEPVVFSLPGRLFSDPLSVSLSAPDAAAQIRFTIDGSAPGPTNGTRYTTPIAIKATTHLRAVAVAQGLTSTISGATYIQLAPDLVTHTSSLPIMVIENFGAGPIRQKGWNGSGAGIKQVPRQTAAWMTFERLNGTSTLTNALQMASLVGIRGRGAYSTEWRQKPYSVEAMTEDGAEALASPLGLPAHADWVLYYPDPDLSRDPTLLFNTFAYELSRNMGHYAVRFRWVEAFINEDGGALSLADRRGVYAIVEKVARGADRLDCQQLATDGSTGGWLLNINRMDPEPDTGWPGPNGAVQPWFFHTAGPNRIFETAPNTSYGTVPGDDQPQQWNAYINFENPNGHTVTLAQRAAIEGWFKQFEDVLYNDMLWRHPTNGYRRYLDTFDFADYFLLNTLTRNGDGLLLSMFPWKGDDGKLRIGPAWDYNWSSYYISGAPTGSLMHRSERLWYPRLFSDPDFLQYYIDRWWDLRRGPVSNAAMDAIIDRQVADIGLEKSLLNGMPSVSEWSRRVGQMKDWLKQRADWIDAQYLRPPVFSQSGGAVPGGFRLAIIGTGGTIYVTTDGTDPRAPGGAVATGARSYTSPIPLLGPTFVQARLRNGANWSGLTAAGFTTPQDLTKLRLTEIMYHPPAAGGWTSDDLEFLELKNTGTVRLDLSTLSFTSGINFTFTNRTLLEPGYFFVLARNPAAFQSVYRDATVNGVYTGRLDNGGEVIRLADSADTTVVEVTYSDATPWPAQADGGGGSLQRKDPAALGNDPSDWIAAAPTPGADFVPGEPTIVQPPISQAVVAGGNITLSVAVADTATLPIRYRWQCNGNAVAGGESLLSERVCFLAITNVQPPQTNYSVVVSNAVRPGGFVSTAAVLTILADRDHDGLPDTWEEACGLNAGDPADRNLDLDGDGMSNWQEYLAGTNPANALSRLKIEAVAVTAESGATLRFTAVSNLTYTVQYRDDVASGEWIRLRDTFARSFDRTELVNDPGFRAHRFYRLITPRQP